MTDAAHARLRALIDRLSRLVAAESWTGLVNPTQAAALGYLARANRYSRSPSQVAEYLAATRGTVSQTLKALERKGLVEERRSETDRRSISYEVTGAGRAALVGETSADRALDALGEDRRRALDDALSALLAAVVAERGGRPFGMCATCRHHQRRGEGGYCRLLEVDLAPEEAAQICYEHEPA